VIQISDKRIARN